MDWDNTVSFKRSWHRCFVRWSLRKIGCTSALVARKQARLASLEVMNVEYMARMHFMLKECYLQEFVLYTLTHQSLLSTLKLISGQRVSCDLKHSLVMSED